LLEDPLKGLAARFPVWVAAVCVASLLCDAADAPSLRAQQPPAPAPAPAQAAPPAKPAQAAPQQPPQVPPEKAFPPVVESVDVSITSVDVVVTDSKGHRVPDLTADDFEVKQDNIPQKITNFYAVSGGKILMEDGKEVPLDKPEAAPEVPQELKAHYVFYIDNLNIQPNNRNRMFKRLKEFIPQAIGPNAEGMVVTYNRSLKVRRPFTSDANDLVGAIENIELDTGGGTTQVGERNDALKRIDESRSVNEATSIARSYSQSLRNDLEFTVDSIKSTLDGLAGVPGRKNFLYVSEGLPATAGFEIYEAIREKYQQTATTIEQLDYDMNSKYAQIIQSANANGVTIYTLDASGLTTNELNSAEHSSTQSVHLNDFMVRQNMQGPIRTMAEETGGIAAINSNDWKSSLDQVAADFSNFYSLGYRSARGAVDRPHRVEVTVKRKGLTVRNRRSYVEKSVETRTAEAVVASLSYPRADNPLKCGLSVGDPKPYDRQNYLLPVRIAVPIGKLGLVPSGDQYEGQFFVYFVILDASGKQSDLQIQRQEVKIPSKDFAMAQGKDFYYDAKLIVVPGGQKLSVGVRDAVSNLTSYLQKSVFVSVLPKEVPKASEPGKS
jgi:VWFA-related protein